MWRANRRGDQWVPVLQAREPGASECGARLKHHLETIRSIYGTGTTGIHQYNKVAPLRSTKGRSFQRFNVPTFIDSGPVALQLEAAHAASPHPLSTPLESDPRSQRLLGPSTLNARESPRPSPRIQPVYITQQNSLRVRTDAFLCTALHHVNLNLKHVSIPDRLVSESNYISNGLVAPDTGVVQLQGFHFDSMSEDKAIQTLSSRLDKLTVSALDSSSA